MSADAWSTAPGVKPTRPDVASIIRQAQTHREHDDVDASTIAVGDTSLKNTDVDDVVGGGSKMGKAQLGSAAVSAALTLHPCVHISGCGDASKLVLHTMFSTVGRCSITMELDDETDEPTGEASAMYSCAADASAAIKTYDGSKFDEGVLRVTVSQRAAQGSLTRRGRGRGGGRFGGGGKGGGSTFHDRQQDMLVRMRAQDAQDERDEFHSARAARDQTGRMSSSGWTRGLGAAAGAAAAGAAAGLVAGPMLPGASAPAHPAQAPANAEGNAPPSKKPKLGASLPKLRPSFVVAKAAAAPAAPAAPAAGRPSRSESDDGSDAGGGLLGLGGYGSSSSGDEE